MKELLLLNMAKGVGSIRTKALLDYFKTAQNVFNASVPELTNVAGIGRTIAENILRTCKDNSLLDKELKLIERHNVKVITIFDEDYPQNLKEIHDPPIVLYTKGEFKEEDKTAVAIVGSRRCSHYGRDTAARLAQELTSLGITVVSGMARGIDTAAHNGALKAGSRTIAVLGSGIGRIYPSENRSLAEKIIGSGVVMSEFPMTMQPLAENFPRRNRVISGLSLGVVVVEAAKDSGALITARCALEQGRDVFSVPGQAGSTTAFGTNQLIRDGAKLVETANDILEELAPGIRSRIGTKSVKIEKMSAENREGLRSEELKILDALEQGPMHIDDIADGALIPIAATSSALTKLEIRGLVKRRPGNVFYRS